MEYDKETISRLIEEEIKYSNNLSEKYNYPDNICHLLYLIIPAFILKYGLNHKSTIEECFNSVPISIKDRQDNIYQAYYSSMPVKEENSIKTIKVIVLNNYKNIGLMQLIDNLVHEYNHAVNSIQNEIETTSNLTIRTGIVKNYFDPKTLRFIKSGEETILEEVINTKQTENIINIIKSFSTYNLENPIIDATLYSINHSIDSSYHSNSYLLESLVCKELLDNKTFYFTIEKLRFDGYIEDIYHWFDSIVGEDNSLIKLSNYLNESLNLQKKLMSTKWFKKHYINKIKQVNSEALKIVTKFHQNTIYK